MNILRATWDSYWMEMLMIAGLTAYFANYIVGKNKNSKLANMWLSTHKSLLDENFALVGKSFTTFFGGGSTSLYLTRQHYAASQQSYSQQISFFQPTGSQNTERNLKWVILNLHVRSYLQLDSINFGLNTCLLALHFTAP